MTITAAEYISEFNLVYNNLASNQAAGLDKYEISVYFTKGQNILVDSLYAEFEKSEEARRKLANLIDTAKLKAYTVSSDKLLYPIYTATFNPALDTSDNVLKVRYIINEQVKMSNNADKCIRGQFVDVTPCLHDELDSIIKNPFRFNIRRALRLDTGIFNSTSTNSESYIEILVNNPNYNTTTSTPTPASLIDYYQIRYVKTPEPIMLYISSEYEDKIDGVSPSSAVGEEKLMTLPETMFRQLVEIAAKLAYQDYKQ